MPLASSSLRSESPRAKCDSDVHAALRSVCPTLGRGYVKLQISRAAARASVRLPTIASGASQPGACFVDVVEGADVSTADDFEVFSHG